MKKKFVYSFGGGKADGNESMKNLLGGKGANLAEMAGNKNLKLPVPPGFTITTEICTYYYEHKRTYPNGLKEEVTKAVKKVEELMGRKFGDPSNPLLASVRSGARRSMPGMMETVLNVGLTEKTIPGLVKQSGGNTRFVYDAYRRLIMMYSDVVMEKAQGIEPKDDESGIRKQLEHIMKAMKKERGYSSDTDLTTEDLKKLCNLFKGKIKEVLKKEFPDEANEQLWGGIGAVFASWNGKRAFSYRRIENIPDSWGTAVTVQTMVFGNMGEDSATGVAFTRNPGNGEGKFYGEYLVNAQGEDVVAGIRTPAPINKYSKSEHNKNLVTLEEGMPKLYKELFAIQKRLEKHYHDMQDIEFTIEKGRLFMLQCRIGKRNGPAAVRMAIDMLHEKVITKEEALMRVTPAQLDELLHPIIDPKVEIGTKVLAKGLPAGPGGATGQAVFSAADAVAWAKQGKKVILVREETNPEDVEGMRAAEAVLTARGGMTSHAALVARGWGKCCVVGCGTLRVDYNKKEVSAGDKIIKEGDWITLNGTKGNLYYGKLPMMDASEENKMLSEFLVLCDSVKRLGVRTNADTPDDAKRALQFGAEGIGLFRTEHMFYGKGADKPLFLLRKMIVSKTEAERKKALEELSPYVKKDIKMTLEAMDGFPVVIRLLDPPLHEFVPREEVKLKQLAQELNITLDELAERAENLHESNPMMGHRGVRLGVTYPEVSEMQIRAVFEAAAELINEGKKPYPEIMIPVVCDVKELNSQLVITEKVYKEVLAKYNLKKIKYMFGTMIEIPRASIVADKLAEVAEFFSFGTNDMTQMGFGFSRDDIGSFLPDYIKKGILPGDPFQSIDQEGIGELIKIGIDRGRKTRKNLEVGICGEHGGEPRSVEFCHFVNMDYVSCSPYRVPIAKLAAAQAVIKEKKQKTK
ncbi:MAG: pyruvate, phosphate dikinase [Candidatus Omnitrophica bacterium CG07_land_8_20_14_0_80_42_15]|uniref:Pyruvate, phosphate dikinase n=1 Tax=Candidatus Aquitaenariimonas noxiae TaxID=1974741 RepID=A0A2J0L013_9BACT|nr:MAG: pyruvate, phosphate dikinase [Candidatus Omnitrophica bacterium CG07_land_8_20_14_0_80_42_15]